MHAAVFGLYMGLFWMLKYLCMIFGNKIELLTSLYVGLTVIVPFIAYRLTLLYRTQIDSESFSFFHGWQFGVFLYTFAALVVSLFHFYYYKNILGLEGISELMQQSFSLLSSRVDTQMLEQAKQAGTPSPFQMTMQGILNNILAGAVFSIPVALLTRKQNTEPNT